MSWRRSALSCELGSVAARAEAQPGSAGKLADRAQHLPPMTERDTQILEILIRQVGKNVDINVVLGKALGVLGHAELFEPVHNLLHHRHRRSGRGPTEFWTAATETLSRYFQDSTFGF